MKIFVICLAVAAVVGFGSGFGDAFGRGVSKKPYSKSNIRFTVNVKSPEKDDNITGYQDYGVLDLYNQAFMHPWTWGLSKFAIAKIYGFDGDDKTGEITLVFSS